MYVYIYIPSKSSNRLVKPKLVDDHSINRLANCCK